MTAALDELRRVAASDENIMPATIAAARAGVTTGEWAAALREAFGSYRAPTGVGEAAAAAPGEELDELREEVARVSEALGRTVKILVGKPGLDGHSNGAEQIAVRARDAGMDVVYEGIRLTPAQIARSAVDEGVHVIGLSILSGSHRELIPDVLAALRDAGGGDIPVVAGGIIPDADAETLRAAGVAAVFTPKDFELTRILRGDREHRRRPPRRTLGGVNGAELGARLRERDLGAAPAALNLLENRSPDARPEIAALLAEVAPGRLGGEAPAHVVGVTGPPGAGKSTLLSALTRAWRADGRTVAVLAVDPTSKRSGGVAARRPRADRGRSRRPRAVHPLDGRRGAARRARAGDPRGRPGARRRVRRRGDRDGRRRPVRDRGGRGGRHRRGRGPARLRRRRCSS